MLLQLPLDQYGIADKEETRARVARERNCGAWHYDGRPVIAAHGVERYGDWSSHMVPLPKGKTLLIPAQAAG
jgi:hypothetical protein